MMEYNLESVLKKIKDFKDELKKLKTHENKDYVEFIDVIFEWLEDLFRVKRWERIRLIPSQWKDIEPLLFLDSFELLKKRKLSLDVLFDETSKFLNKIVEIGNISMLDFDLLQFNLARIFGKNADAIVERVRVNLDMKLEKLREGELRKRRMERKIREVERQKILSMPEPELRKYVVSQMFDFTPSARTPEERMKALRKNREKVIAQRERFREFAIRLHEATDTARAEAETRVRLRAGEVRKGLLKVSEEFREKAKEFVSEEGFIMDVQKARKRIEKGSVNVSKQMINVRKEFQEKAKEFVSEEGFRKKVSKSREKMLKRRSELNKDTEDKRKLIRKRGIGRREIFAKEADEARKVMLEKRKELQSDQNVKRKMIESRGDEEIAEAREMMLEGKEHFSGEVEQAKDLFAGKEKEIEQAREGISKGRIEFTVKKGEAKERFERRAIEVEGFMSTTVLEEKKDFERARVEARQKFLHRAQEVKETGLGEMDKMKEGMRKFHGKKGEFLAKSKELREGMKKLHGKKKLFRAKGKELKYKPIPTEKITSAARRSEEQIKKESEAMLKKAKELRQGMIKEIKHRKELFLLDTRFARHKFIEAATAFKERAEEKNEEFKTRQQTLVARHKAKQKAHMIRNLLRTIRTMK